MGFEHLIIVLCAALLPPLILLRIVFKMDRVEPEPRPLLIRLFVYGVLCALPVMVLELWGQKFANLFGSETMTYAFIGYFIIPGFIEEGMKYAVLRGCTWRHPAFNYKFDAVVYAVFASLGFAAFAHGAYDFLIMAYGGAVFAVYFIALIVLGVTLAKSCARNDAPVDPFVTGGEEIDPQ